MAGAWLLLSAVSADAQEVFSWWRRGLLPLDLSAGAWVRLERRESAEGQVGVDTLYCAVLADPGDGTRWVELSLEGRGESWVFRMAPERLPESTDVLGALLDLYSISSSGEVVREEIDELRGQRLVRRHFRDLFRDPQLVRQALPDTTFQGEPLTRERVALREEQDTRLPMGARTLVHTTVVESVAEISASIPVFGVLRARTVSTVTSHYEGKGPAGRRPPPPLISEVELRCLAFGHDGTKRLPAGVSASPSRSR